jgi:hypothetical protein
MNEENQGVTRSSAGRSAALRAEPASAVSGLRPAATNAAHTPGPWGWYGNQHGVYLATAHSGRRFVMGFRRMGTQGAQPTFQVNQRMVPASALVRFEVGDGRAKGFAQGKTDESVYRYDIRDIDAADARLIAAAPDTYEATEAAHEFAAMFLAFVGRDQGTTRIDKTLDDLSEMAVTLDAKARAALAKARGE